ncbi:OmpW/AlkL family protein [Acinetobacter sp. CAAS 2-6]|uniref:OmpW/AlkL family protein n=1 Tax=Acinetobacter sp. CAAS 2-6 TaxID=3016358 RepID=UPI002DD69E78|nr:OmpW family outer membrane protein [Acinetobacter sp. CAAS 2-6]
MLKQAAVITLLGLSSATFAGGWQVKVGASAIAPSGESDLAGGLNDVSATNEIGFTPAIEYFFADTPFSAELLLAAPYKHEIETQGTKIGSFKHLPPTLTVKYNFKNTSRFTPYIGVGATAVIPFDEQLDSGADLKVDNAYGVAGQVGFSFQPADAKNWGVYADVRYADIATDVEVNGANLGELEVNPWVYTVGYSYKF